MPRLVGVAAAAAAAAVLLVVVVVAVAAAAVVVVAGDGEQEPSLRWCIAAWMAEAEAGELLAEVCWCLHERRANSSPVDGCHLYKAYCIPRTEGYLVAGMLGSRRLAVGYQLRPGSPQKMKRRKGSLAVTPVHRCELSYLVEARILAVERLAKDCVAEVRKPAEGLATETAP